MGSRGNEGDFSGRGMRFAIVAGRYNSVIVDRLVSAAVAVLHQHDVARQAIRLIHVPGAFELPLACQRVAAQGQVDAVIALGAVIRGDTPHFDYVAGACAHGLSEVALKSDLPVVFGVLTVDNLEQARARAGDGEDNKGAEAALTALEMVTVLRELGS